jgi:hypothetical protein
VLPSHAVTDFAPGEVHQVSSPFLKFYARPISLAWNPRLTEVRPAVERAIKAMDSILAAAASGRIT